MSSKIRVYDVHSTMHPDDGLRANIIAMQNAEEDDRFWRGKIITWHDGSEGWLQVELMKQCFDVVEG
jgi:hypothetical protein